MRRYGEEPASLGVKQVDCKEMMFYQYLPIKLPQDHFWRLEPRLECFDKMILDCVNDFLRFRGGHQWCDSYVYLTVKCMFQLPGCSFNREGWHSDGFMTDDVNYIWSDNNPTEFHSGPFTLTQHHEISLKEMECLDSGHFGPAGELLRLDQFNIHRVAVIPEPTMRTFFKLSISKDQYNLIGNSHNHLLNYSWELKDREAARNHPSK